MIDLVEKAARIKSGLVLEAKHLRNTQAKTTKGVESQKRTWDNREGGPAQTRFPLCTTCGKKHGGACWANTGKCYKCGQIGHNQQNCSEGFNNCRRCGHRGHFARDCTMHLGRGQQGIQNMGILPPPPKRQAVGPRVYALEGQDGAEPIAGEFFFMKAFKILFPPCCK